MFRLKLEIVYEVDIHDINQHYKTLQHGHNLCCEYINEIRQSRSRIYI